MWTQSHNGQVYVRKLVQEVVQDVAPEEIDLFEELIQDYYSHPLPPKKDTRKHDKTLGFGLPETVAAVTPAAAAMAIAVINYLLSASIQAVQDEASQAVSHTIGQKIRQWLNPPASEKTDPNFSHDQLALVRDLACGEAQKFGVTSDEAAKLADALIGRLALS